MTMIYMVKCENVKIQQSGKVYLTSNCHEHQMIYRLLDLSCNTITILQIPYLKKKRAAFKIPTTDQETLFVLANDVL
jgi:hypothetical protein